MSLIHSYGLHEWRFSPAGGLNLAYFRAYCEVWEVEGARGGCRRERVERACIDTGQPEG